jgi:GntP family gluconate:H+ symporter
MLRLTGPRRAPEALAASSFVLGIPVFFDTVFYLMIPLARSLRRKLGSNYVLYILAILAGGSIAHSLVPPTPGPLLVAGELGVDIGTMMVAGLAIGGCSSFVSLAAARLINRLVDVPLRFEEETSDVGGVDAEGDEEADQRERGSALHPGGHEQPSLIKSLAPIAVPVLLITTGSVIDYAWESGGGAADSSESDRGNSYQALLTLLLALANKNVALGIGVVLAFSLLRYCPAAKRPSLVSRSLASAGNIILITAAGGAFGAMLRQAGIESAVGSLARDVPGIMILPVAFAVTAAIRTLQGSATVAMITAVGVLQGFAAGLPFHPVYLAMAIGAGSKPVSWMTDSAFWVITRMSGMTEAEGLRVISPMSTAMGLSALVFTMLFASIYPAL